MHKTKLEFDKPVYVGACIFDHSKTLMYKFYYNCAKKKWKDLSLCFTDTDSLLYEIGTEDFYKDISEDVETMYDRSDYPKEGHPSGIPVGKNKKVIGLMKHECAGKSIAKFVRLRAKLYSVKMDEGKENKKCKGVAKNVVKKEISFEDYVQCLFSRESQIRKVNLIRSRKHAIFSKRIVKVSLSAEDDKRNILEDGIRTLALGHWRM